MEGSFAIMSMEHDIELKVNYSVKDCFDAVLQSVSSLSNYEVTEQNDIIGTIRIKVKGIMASPGDYVSATITQEAANVTKVLIKGGVKVPYMMAKRNCIKNSEAIAAAFANEIANYEKVEEVKTTKIDNSIEATLERLKSMYQKELITLEEYEQKKKEIINSMF
jgi:hypothetical protein